MKLVTYDEGRLGAVTPRGGVDLTELGGLAPRFWPAVGMNGGICGHSGTFAAGARGGRARGG